MMNKMMKITMAVAALALVAGSQSVKADLGNTAELSARKYAPYPLGERIPGEIWHRYLAKDCNSTGHIYSVGHIYDSSGVAIAVCYMGQDFNVDDVDHFLKLNYLPLISDHYWKRYREELDWVSQDGKYYLHLTSPMGELRNIIISTIETAQAHEVISQLVKTNNATPAK